MLEKANILFTFDCIAAEKFAIIKDAAIINAKALVQTSLIDPNPIEKRRNMAAKAAVLTMVLIKAVINVGEPS